MTSHGQNPSRRPDEKPVYVKISDGDSSHPGSHGGDRSRGPGGPPGSTPTSSGGSNENWFPVSSRYKRLGEPIPGGMGVVYKALDVNLDIEVAIKRIRPEFAANEDLISRFEREAKTQVRLRHANLVQVRDYSKDNIGPYIVMDWIDGESLAAAIDKTGPMEWQRAAVLISKVAMALQVAHEAGIIHRDVKPANILLDVNGEPYITDFGLARIEATQSRISETATNAMLGTINFASPEQQRNPRNACFQSDIWSLGATLYKAVTGFDVLAMRESLIPEQIRPIVLKATEHAIDARYGTMRLMSQILQATATASISSATSPNAKSTVSVQNATLNESDLASMWRQTQERVENAHSDAKALAEKQQDYAKAVEILETIPSNLRKAKLFAELVRRRDRVAALDAVIRESVAQFRSAGLRDSIEELLKLQPNRQDVRQLLSQLPPEPAPVEKVVPPKVQPTPTSSIALPAVKNPVSPSLLVDPFDANQAKAVLNSQPSRASSPATPTTAFPELKPASIGPVTVARKTTDSISQTARFQVGERLPSTRNESDSRSCRKREVVPQTSYSTWLGAYIVGLSSFFGIFSIMCTLAATDFLRFVVGIGFLIAVVCSIWSAVSFCKTIFRMWSVFGGSGKPTPGMAVGLLFVPLYNAYWLYFVYVRWAVEYESWRLTRPRESAPECNVKLAKMTVLLSVTGLIPFVGIVGILGSLILWPMSFRNVIQALNYAAANVNRKKTMSQLV